MEEIAVLCILLGCILCEMAQQAKSAELKDCELNNDVNFTLETIVQINNCSFRGHFPKEVFANLRNLNFLILENFNVTNISDIIQNNTELKQIHFSNNYLTVIPDNIFKNNNRVISLEIVKNRISVLNGKTFDGLSNISFLDLSFNNISIVNEEIFSKMNSLEELNLNSNKIVQIPKNTFRSQQNLKLLDLSGNNISKLENHIFKTLTKLETLYIQYNRIINIEKNIFLSQKNLKILDLSGNNIGTIKDIFENLDNLEKLDLSSNNLTNISSEIKNCTHLRTLLLNHNYITNLSKHFFNITFETVEIINNAVETIELNFTMITRNVTIDLSDNNRDISKINVTVEGRIKHNLTLLLYRNTIICDGNVNFFKVIHNISVVDDRDDAKVQCYDPYRKRYSRIHEVNYQDIIESFGCLTVNSGIQCDCYKQQFHNTRIVDCSYRNLTEIPNMTKYADHNQAVGESIILNMTGNMLQHIDKVPSDYNNITRIINLKIFLSKNKIETFTWIPHSKLKVLTLNDNQLRYLSEDVLEAFKNINVLALENNPWSCQCSLVLPLWKVVKRSKVNITENLRCDNIQPRGWNDDPICNDYSNLKVILSVSLLLILLIVTISSVTYNKTLIKAWLYHKRWFLWFVQEEDLDKNKIYDVFVCYAHQEDDFVNSTLLPWLDSLVTMKICIHIRNFIPGENILEQSVWSIRNSRRILVVLTNNFLNSGWCVEEFNAAYNWSIEEKRKRLIAIKYGPLDEQDMNETIKTYIKTTTYLEWGSYGFWNKLEYALPHHKY